MKFRDGCVRIRKRKRDKARKRDESVITRRQKRDEVMKRG